MLKWMFDNRFKIISIYLGYSLAWYFGWQASVGFETITNITSWFLPAGIRVASLILINKKYWFVIALAEFTGIYVVNSEENSFTTILGEAVGTFIPFIIYMVTIHFYLKSTNRVRFELVSHVIKFFTWTGLGAFLTAVTLVTSLVLQEQLTYDLLITTILLFMLGDFVGILMLVPLAIAIKFLLTKEITYLKLKNSFSLFNTVLISTLIILTVFFIQQGMVYYIKLFALIPIIIFAYKNGWIGATFSLFIVNIIILVVSFISSDASNLLERQLYLIAISMTGLLLGAAMSEQKHLNLTLAIKNKDLLTLIEKNQFLAQKIINIQENERKIISRELHDELGQNITGLKLNIQVIKKMVGKSKISPILESLDNIADITYKSTYDLMHWLRPRVLDDLGLKQALSGNAFKQLLNNANIEYISTLKGDFDLLNDDITIAVYRIAQECVNNTIKHSKAKHCWLSLIVEDSVVTLEVKNDGQKFDVDQINKLKSSFGLQGIEDRVLALGGAYTLSSYSNETIHKVLFNKSINIQVQGFESSNKNK